MFPRAGSHLEIIIDKPQDFDWLFGIRCFFLFFLREVYSKKVELKKIKATKSTNYWEIRTENILATMNYLVNKE